jgi:hypothetical protein
MYTLGLKVTFYSTEPWEIQSEQASESGMTVVLMGDVPDMDRAGELL